MQSGASKCGNMECYKQRRGKPSDTFTGRRSLMIILVEAGLELQRVSLDMFDVAC